MRRGHRGQAECSMKGRLGIDESEAVMRISDHIHLSTLKACCRRIVRRAVVCPN